MSLDHYVEFYNGVKMPIIGLGTWQSKDEEIESALTTALEIGYRHIDTAYLYTNEEAIGRALKDFLENNKNVKREDIFITTKLPTFALKRELVEGVLKKSLERLQLSYVDLYLVHAATGVENINEEAFPVGPDGNIVFDMKTNLEEIWKGMEAIVDAGLAKSIGISNFNSKQIQRIIDSARIKPANLQVECHAYLPQTKLFEFCKERGVTFCAYAPIGNPSFGQFIMALGRPDPKFPKLLEEPTVVEISKKHKKSPAQVLLRWLIQRGIVVIPKSVSPARIKENFDVFDFVLSDAESAELNKVDKNLRIFDLVFAKNSTEHPEYPFKIPF